MVYVDLFPWIKSCGETSLFSTSTVSSLVYNKIISLEIMLCFSISRPGLEPSYWDYKTEGDKEKPTWQTNHKVRPDPPPSLPLVLPGCSQICQRLKKGGLENGDIVWQGWRRVWPMLISLTKCTKMAKFIGLLKCIVILIIIVKYIYI